LLSWVLKEFCKKVFFKEKIYLHIMCNVCMFVCLWVSMVQFCACVSEKNHNNK
jgi:hypothetical protein